MNQIPTKQNSPQQLERLAAQRELYSAAKTLHVVQIITTVAIPIVLAIIALFSEEFSVVVAIFGVAAFIADISLIEPEINKKKTKAAKIQELFDCEVLELPKSPLKVVDDVTVEEVLQHYDAHAKIASNIEKIKDWYSPTIGVLPLATARILCQRTNCWWDSKLRNNYSNFLKFSAIGIFSIIILIGLIGDLSLIYVTLIASGLVPFFQFCIKQRNDNLDAAKRLNQLVQFSTSLWEKAFDGTPDDKLCRESRKLQDEIFEHRKRSPLILNLYYDYFRDKDEVLMNRSSQILVDEALQRNS